jgi:uncharacterized phage-associated protein
MYPATTIAYAFIKRGIDECNPINQMKLQKMLYFAHGYHLILYKKPLIKEIFQAWKYGPVIPSVYHSCKIYGSGDIIDTSYFISINGEPNLKLIDSESLNTINITWEILKDISGLALSSWTHTEGSPWIKHYIEGVNDIPIPNKDIEEYFSSFLKKSETTDATA